MSRRSLATGTVAALVVLTACAGERPSASEWRTSWQLQRDGMPDAETLVAGGEDGCGELLGRLRVELDDLTPTPSEALDEAVEAWTSRAESIAFECPGDEDEARRRLDELDVIAAEIDAGLRAG